jgi:perosamine synthetase
MMRVPLARVDVGELERRYVLDALESGWLSGNGPYVERFESAWAQRCETRHAVAVASGTAALHLLLLAHGVGHGDEVIVPAMTYAAVANAVHHTGAVPVVVDVEPATWCLSPTAVVAAITSRTVGVIAVHAYGHPADMSAICAVAERAGLWVLEDGAEAHLATCHGAIVGGLGAAAAFSFFGNKIVTTGEGGAVTTNDDRLAEAVRALARQGVRSEDDRYRPSLVGLGLRLGNLAAAAGCAQIDRIDELVERRRRASARYQSDLGDVAGITMQPVAPWATRAPWLFSIVVDDAAFGRSRDELHHDLANAGIESRPLFPPLGGLPNAEPTPHACPIATHLAGAGLSLPLFAGIDDHELARIIELVRRR